MGRVAYILFLIFVSIQLSAQDMHFSHFYAAPLNLNPANTGNFDGTWRIGGNYKNQWQSFTVPYRTFSGYGDFKLLRSSRSKSQIAVGGYMINDEAGDGNLTTRKIFGNVALHRAFGYYNEFSLSAGIGVGYIQKSLDFSKLIFDSQWTPKGFNALLPTNELPGAQSLNYIDIQAGAIGNYNISDESSIYIGVTYAHAIEPAETFLNSGNKLGSRPVIHGGAYFPLTNLLNAEPAFIYMNQKKASELIAGSNFGFDLQKQNYTAAIFGLWFRGSGDAVPVVGMDYRTLRVLLSYDINFSSLKTTSRSMGGIEISVQYIGFIEKKPYSRIVPCIRF